MINGEPWFVAADLASALDFRDAHNAARGLDEEDVRTHEMSTNAGLREFKIVNESGLYSMIMRSVKPEAKAFKRWVTSEVLPSIRKTGQYGNIPQTYPEALRALAAAEEARALVAQERDKAWGEATRVRAIADDQHAKIERDSPKVEYVEHFVEPSGDLSLIRTLATELSISERRLFAYLVARRRIYQDRYGMYHPYADWKAWFTLRDHRDVKPLADGRLRTTLYVTPVGKVSIKRMLERDPIS